MVHKNTENFKQLQLKPPSLYFRVKKKKKKHNFRQHLKIKQPYNPAVPLSGIYLEETRIEKDPYTSMFNAALFTIAITWKEPRCPSANEWIKKLWYTYTMEYYSAIEGNAFDSVLMRQMNLVLIIQSEVRKRNINIIY